MPTKTQPSQGTRSNVVLDGIHGPVTIHVQVIPQQSLETYYHINAKSAGLAIRYRGHKDDLLAAGCVKESGCRGHFHEDGHGGVWYLSSKAGPGKRGFVQMQYFTSNRAFAATLPAVRVMFPEALDQLATRPSLRLVVDNTQEVTHG